ncbi:MAG: PIN domain-containing protein [Victivallales bacterium]|nr:PIN domain-containing protein [Victivallales bacterium]
MRPERAVIDTGPIVALFDNSDKFHPNSLDFIKENDRRLYTTLPVITEVMFLLDFNVNAQSDFLLWIYSGAMEIPDLRQDDFKRIPQLMKKYRNLPMDFADASVVLACENLETKYVATLDKDFNIYRYQDRHPFRNIFITD